MNDNKLIAEFMEYHTTDNQFKGEDGFWNDTDLFEKSWDFLMPVVENIEQINEGVPQQMLHVNLYSEIGEVYTAVVNFIKTYNDDTRNNISDDKNNK